MTRFPVVSAAMLVSALSGAMFALQTAPPIRAVSAPTAMTVEPMKYIDEVREIPGGKLLVNSGDEGKLFLFDASLARASVLLDTGGTGASHYPRIGKLLPYVGDSSLFLESDSRSFVVIDPQGTLGRVMALPRVQDFNILISTGPVGFDGRGNVLYRGRRDVPLPYPCPAPDVARPQTPPSDSGTIVRGNFETRKIDTVGRERTVQPFDLPVIVYDGNCKITSATVHLNASVPAMDAWTVTSRGSIAIVRGHDYHVDFIDPDGTRRTGPKLPFDWRRLTDADKQRRIDSVRKIIDSVSARGGYRMQKCGPAITYTIEPPDSIAGHEGSVMNLGRAARGAEALQCQTVNVTPVFVPLSEMADYLAPIRDDDAMADLDGNVWILPTTSLSAKGGLLYDVVGPTGDMVERVQLPADRILAGFGRGGVLYLLHRVVGKGAVIERVTVVRPR